MSVFRSLQSRFAARTMALLLPLALLSLTAPEALADGTSPTPITAADVQWIEGSVACVNSEPVWTNPSYIVTATDGVSYTPLPGTYGANFGDTLTVSAAADSGDPLANQASWPETHTFGPQPPAPVDCVPPPPPTPLQANDDSFSHYGGAWWTLNVLHNDTAPNGDPLKIVHVTKPNDGLSKVKISSNGSKLLFWLASTHPKRTVTATYVAEDTVTGLDTNAASVGVYTMPVAKVKGRRLGAHRARFHNPNPFTVLVKVNVRAVYNHRRNVDFKVAAHSTKTVHWTRRAVPWNAFHIKPRIPISGDFM